MSVDYSSIASNADAMLSEFGQTVTVTTNTYGSYDTATGSNSVSTSTQTASAVILDYARTDAGMLNADGSLVLNTDKQCYVSALTTSGISLQAPKPDITTVTDVNSNTFTVKNVKAVSPAGTPVLYELNLRA